MDKLKGYRLIALDSIIITVIIIPPSAQSIIPLLGYAIFEQGAIRTIITLVIMCNLVCTCFTAYIHNYGILL